MVSDVRSVALNLNSKELIFLQKVTRQEYHFITDEEQEARLRLRDKLLEGFFDQNENRIVLNLTRDELLFLIKVARENYSFIVRTEKEARLALAEVQVREAEVDGDPALLLFLEAVGVGPGQGAHQRALAVVDVSGGPHDQRSHGRLAG